MNEYETGWLLDDGLLALGADPCAFIMVPYTSPNVIRFARQEDAERMKKTLVRLGYKHIVNTRPVDHAWYTGELS